MQPKCVAVCREAKAASTSLAAFSEIAFARLLLGDRLLFDMFT